MTPATRNAVFIAAILLAPVALSAQDAGDKPAEKANDQGSGDEPKERSTGLPSQIKWLLNVDVSSFGPEDFNIGWRSGNSLPDLGDNALDFTLGRCQYRIGHGFLLWDGAAEGGSRGGYWSNARKAFQFAAIGRLKPGAHTVETFYLDKDELAESDSGTRLWGANYEYAFGAATSVGATYMKMFAHQDINPGRDGLSVFNIRTYAAPLARTPGLTFEFEYASERNGDALDSNAWTIQSGDEFNDTAWKPKLTYRYAYVQGDDPDIPANEAFDPLLLGFSDWGTWRFTTPGPRWAGRSLTTSASTTVSRAPSTSSSPR